MIKKVIKRDKTEQPFSLKKLKAAIKASFVDISNKCSRREKLDISSIAHEINEEMSGNIGVEAIQDAVEKKLMEKGYYDQAKQYILYRDEHARLRGAATDKTVEEICAGASDYWSTENSNKNANLASTQRDYIAGAISEDITRRKLLPADVTKAFDEGIIHFHDIDYFIEKIHNCCLVNLGDMLQNGTVINKTLIEKPHSFSTASTIATQIMACIASGQYGGQTIYLSDLSPFVDVTRKSLYERVKEWGIEEDKVDAVVDNLLRKDIKDGVQTMQYQINTLNTSNGQSPFVSVFIYLDDVPEGQQRDDLAMVASEVFRQRYQGTKNEAGVYVTPAFPKLLYVLDEDNITEDSKYWWLTQEAAQCTARRMVPDYISAKKMKEYHNGDVYACMGCRSFPSTDEFTDRGAGNIANAGDYVEGKRKYKGRFNQGVVTLNLVDVALTAKRDDIDFFELLDERCELAHKALRCRHERLKGTLSDISPIHWQYGGLARLQPGEIIDKLLYDGYSTISLGYAGLWECVLAYTGNELYSEDGKKFGTKIMKMLNDKCNQWKKEENIGYSVYGTPLESSTYRFAKKLKEKFGIIPGITDKDYITNSYHYHVTKKVDAFTKLADEGEFQQYSLGGCISYIEAPNVENNIPAVLEVMKFIYDKCEYAEINIKSDYCQTCGYHGEMMIDDNMQWYCPNCGERRHTKLNVARRTCGYIGSQFWNNGRTQEIKERVIHLDNDDDE